MSFSNVKLILSREIRDQLRDRRTLFMMFVLPLLLYPLLGMSYLQISQFTQTKPTSVLVIGLTDLGDLPPLVEDGQFAKSLFTDPDRARLLELHFDPSVDREAEADRVDWARRAVQAAQYDAALCFPDTFAQQTGDYRRAIEQWTPDSGQEEGSRLPELPRPLIVYTTANERSQAAFLRLSVVLDGWHEQVRQSIWAAGGLPPSPVAVPEPEADDVADQTSYHGAALWSKILPVMLLIWALTGAFYPAVDLCAGEKERGTLETLLSAPARRSEIVLGKLVTIMLFSATTAVLNLLSVGATGCLVLARFPEFSPPPPMSALWLALALLPISALFSALCLALAAFARSTKEGQYYLMPLLLITMPLAVMPMAPGVELTLGNSLIPVTGMVLLLRTLLEGSYWEALRLAPVVVAVTGLACVLAIRWAVDQFNSESVLFRESERLDLRLWARHLVRDRRPTPGVAAAVACALAIMLIHFVLNFLVRGFYSGALLPQLVAIAMPALLMTLVLSGSPRQTLLLKVPPLLAVPASMLLVVTVYPLVHTFQIVVMRLYPISEEMAEALEGFIPEGVGFWQLVLLMAVLPAIFEELAFRGFILSGLRHLGHRWRAIIYTAVLFGLVHGIVQQQVIACVVGVLLGYVAVQTGSILPCMLFHLLHNTLRLASMEITPEVIDRQPFLAGLVDYNEEIGPVFHWPVVVVAAVATALLLFFFHQLPRRQSDEERLQEAIDLGLSGTGE